MRPFLIELKSGFVRNFVIFPIHKHNSNYVVLHIDLDYKAKPLNFSSVFRSYCHNIDSSRGDTAVTQNICKFRNIFFDAIEGPGKELAEVVWKDLGRIDARGLTQPFHLRPNIAAIQRIPFSRNKYCSIMDLVVLKHNAITVFSTCPERESSGFYFCSSP